MSKMPTPEERKKWTKELKDHHQPLLDQLGQGNAPFLPKVKYKDADVDDYVMGFFESELEIMSDNFIEIVDMEYNPTEENRQLYKLRHNPHFKTEYMSKPMSNNKFRYLVPVDELVKVDSPAPVEELGFDLANPNDGDAPLSKLTIRDAVAIYHGKPVSRKDWLNELIKQVKK